MESCVANKKEENCQKRVNDDIDKYFIITHMGGGPMSRNHNKV